MDAEHSRSVELLQRAQALVTDQVDAVEREQWDVEVRPGSTVADLVAHLVVGQRALVPLLAGGPVPRQSDDVPGRGTTEAVLDGDPLGSWESAADEALTSWALHGDPATPVDTPQGPRTAIEHVAALAARLTDDAGALARVTGVGPV